MDTVNNFIPSAAIISGFWVVLRVFFLPSPGPLNLTLILCTLKLNNTELCDDIKI